MVQSSLKAQCRPNYFTGFIDYGLFYSVADSITRVTFHTLDNYSGNSAPITDSIYSDYTHLSTSVCKGQSYTLTVRAGDTSIYQTGVIAWIDFNNNGTFETSEMVLRDSVKFQNRSQAASASVLIPLSASTGSVKMRVLSAYTIASVFPNRMPPNDPCFNYAAVCNDSFPSLIGIPYPDLDPGCNLCISCDALSGEMEEYTIDILDRPTTVLTGSQTLCPGNGASLSFSLNGASPWNLTYTNGTTPVVVTGITASPYVVALTPSATTTYSPVSVSDNVCPGGISGTAILTVTPPAQAQLSGSHTICPGNSIQLSFQLVGQSPWSFSYSDGTTTSSLTGVTASPWLVSVTPAGSRTYSPTLVSDACSAGTVSGSHTVQVAPALSAVLSGGGNVCAGSSTALSVALSGVSPWTLTWTDGTTPATRTGITASPFILGITPAAFATYSLVSVADNCLGSGSVSGTAVITRNILPTASLSNGNTYFCQTPSISFPVTLSGTAPWNVSWTDGTNTLTATGITGSPYSISVTPGSSVTYSLVSLTDAFCTGTALTGTYRFTLDGGPAATVSGSQSLCTGQSATIQITGTPGAQPWNFTFSDGTASVTHSGITALPYSFSVTPAQTATWSVSSVTHPCPVASVGGTVVLQVNPIPTATWSGPAQICAGNAAVLTVSLTGNAPWSIDYSDGSAPVSLTGITASPWVVSLSPAAPTTYTLNQVQSAGCGQVASSSVAVGILQPAQAVFSGGGAICSGSSLNLSATLSGTSPYELDWSDGSGTQTVTGIIASSWVLSVSPLATTTYSLVQVRNTCGNGTLTNSNQVVTLLSNPQAALTGDQTICGAGQTQLTVVFSQAAGPYSLAWSDGTAAYLTTGISASPYVLTVSALANTTYSLTAVNNGSCGGTVSGNGTVTVLPAPAITWQDSAGVCLGSGIGFSIPLSGTAPWDITYSDGLNAQVISGISASPYLFQLTPTAAATYQVTGIADAICPTTASGIIQVAVNPIPAILLSVPSPVCQGAVVPVTVTLAGTAPWNLDWTDGTSTQTLTGITQSPYIFPITPSATASYGSVQLQDAYCTDMTGTALSLTVTPLPIAHFTVNFVNSDTVQFTNASQHFSNVNWDFGDQNSSAQLNPLHGYGPLPNSSVVVKLIVSNVCGSDEFDTSLVILPSMVQAGQAYPVVSVSPNPAGDWVNISGLPGRGEWQYSLTDIQGRQVWVWETLPESGVTRKTHSLPAGSYLIQLRSVGADSQSWAIRLLKN